MTPSIPSPASSTFRGLVASPDAVPTDLLFIPVFGSDDVLADLPDPDGAVGGEWTRAISSGVFTHKPYATVLAKVLGSWKARHLCFIGVGNRHEADAVRWLRVSAACGYVARQQRVSRYAWLVRAGLDVTGIAAAAADGLSAAEFDGAHLKTDPSSTWRFQPSVDIVALPGQDQAALDAAVLRGRTIGHAVNVTRAFANEAPNVLPPREFATRVAAAGHEAGLQVEVLDESRMETLGMRLLLAVGQASVEPSQMVVLRYEPEGAPESPVIALVGKGVTFDTGGISIKPADSMDRMKSDMAGGAAVAAAMCALPALKTPVRVIGIIPMVENMPGGKAFRPGDVVAGASGKTVEVLNTDAEGRLILADALWYAQQLGATHLVDIATLTGHCLVALGRTVAGLMGSPDEWVAHVRATADHAGDRVWPLPIYEEALEQIRSEIADLANVGGRPGGALTAAAFLREFTGGLPWAHLDIAGTAWAESRTPFQPKGATGSGVRTLIAVAAGAGVVSPARKG